MRYLRFLQGSPIVAAGLAVFPGQDSDRRGFSSWLWLLLIIVLIVVVIGWLRRRPKREEGASLPAATQRPVEMPKPAATLAAAAPEIKMPAVETPAVATPLIEMPAVEMPAVETPALEMPTADLPEVEMPMVETPALELPEAAMPEVEMPAAAMPEMSLPEAATTAAEAPAPAAPLLAARVAAGGQDDLTRIEGIGPKVSATLDAAGISTFEALAAADVGDLRHILRHADLHVSDPTSWPDQAKLAAAGDWAALEALQARLVAGRYVDVDDLTIIEGIGPKVAAILNQAGITSFRHLADANVSDLEQLLRTAGLRMMNPTTWPEQARLASLADHEGLQKLQEQLKGGRRA